MAHAFPATLHQQSRPQFQQEVCFVKHSHSAENTWVSCPEGIWHCDSGGKSQRRAKGPNQRISAHPCEVLSWQEQGDAVRLTPISELLSEMVPDVSAHQNGRRKLQVPPFWWPLCSEQEATHCCPLPMSSPLYPVIHLLSTLRWCLKDITSIIFSGLSLLLLWQETPLLSLKWVSLCTLKLSTWKFFHVRQDSRLLLSFMLNSLQQHDRAASHVRDAQW